LKGWAPHSQKLPGAGSERPAGARTTKNSMSPPSYRSFGNLWKTRTTRNFAGSPAFCHIPGIGRCCIVRVLKPCASETTVVRPQSNTTETGALTGPGRKWPGLLFFRTVMAVTVRIICILAVAIAIGPSLAYGSPTCMTESEARAKFPKATHLYMRKNCWSDSATNTVQARSAAMPVHSPRHPPRAAVPAPSPRPALAAVPAASPRPEPASNGIDPGTQCRYSPCE
jgi:hypothetical protein